MITYGLAEDEVTRTSKPMYDKEDHHVMESKEIDTTFI